MIITNKTHYISRKESTRKRKYPVLTSYKQKIFNLQNTVIFTNEFKFNLLGSMILFLCRKPNEELFQKNLSYCQTRRSIIGVMGGEHWLPVLVICMSLTIYHGLMQIFSKIFGHIEETLEHILDYIRAFEHIKEKLEGQRYKNG